MVTNLGGRGSVEELKVMEGEILEILKGQVAGVGITTSVGKSQSQQLGMNPLGRLSLILQVLFLNTPDVGRNGRSHFHILLLIMGHSVLFPLLGDKYCNASNV